VEHDGLVAVSEIDVEALESAAATLLRLRRTQEAVKLYAFALHLRRDMGLLPGKERRCAVT
jgi:hypothetical protein